MQYMLMICGTEGAEPEQGFDMAAATEAWGSEMDGRGVRLQGSRLRPVSDATTVRVCNNEVLICDGPFAETPRSRCSDSTCWSVLTSTRRSRWPRSTRWRATG